MQRREPGNNYKVAYYYDCGAYNSSNSIGYNGLVVSGFVYWIEYQIKQKWAKKLAKQEKI